MIKDLLMLKNLPQLGSQAGFGLIFLFGLLTSFHCLGMCGGILISQTSRKLSDTGTDEDRRSWILPALLYNGGRVISYTLVGGVVGAFGQFIGLTGILKGIVPLVGGLFMMLMAINYLGLFPSLKKFNIRMPSFIAKKIFKQNHYSPLIVGLLSGFMPCGPLQMAQLYALGTKSFVQGAAALFAFALGTLPLLFAFGVLHSIINKKYSKRVIQLSALLIFVLGGTMVGRGLALSGINLSLSATATINWEDTVENIALLQGNVQYVNSSLTKDSYPAILVQQGIPVKWNLTAEEDQLNYCNNEIMIPALKLEQKLVAGVNEISFYPEKTGEILYTCWMGMIKSKIIVVEDISSFQAVPEAEDIASADGEGVKENTDEEKGAAESENGIERVENQEAPVPQESKSAEQPAQAETQPEIKLLTIEGMTCEVCIRFITESLDALPEVTGVDVSLGSARVELSAPISDEALKVAVANAGEGYRVIKIE